MSNNAKDVDLDIINLIKKETKEFPDTTFMYWRSDKKGCFAIKTPATEKQSEREFEIMDHLMEENGDFFSTVMSTVIVRLQRNKTEKEMFIKMLNDD